MARLQRLSGTTRYHGRLHDRCLVSDEAGARPFCGFPSAAQLAIPSAPRSRPRRPVACLQGPSSECPMAWVTHRRAPKPSGAWFSQLTGYQEYGTESSTNIAKWVRLKRSCLPPNNFGGCQLTRSERVDHADLSEPVPMLQILGQQDRSAQGLGRRDNDGIPPRHGMAVVSTKTSAGP